MRSFYCFFVIFCAFLLIESNQQLIPFPCERNQNTSCPDGFLYNYAICKCDQITRIVQKNGRFEDELTQSSSSSRSCPKGYQWNGNTCIIQISMESAVYVPFPQKENCEKNSQIAKSESYSMRPRIVFPRQPNRVQPENYESHRPARKCLSDYTWDGTICVKSISVSAQCPPNYYLTGEHCERRIRGECSENYRLIGTECIDDQQNRARVKCPNDYIWSGYDCRQYTTICDSGNRYVDGKCQTTITALPKSTQECDGGYEYVNGICVSHRKRCRVGYRLENDICVEISPSCPSDYEYDTSDSTCVQILSTIDVTESNSQTEISTQATESTRKTDEVNSMRPTCPKDYVLEGYYCAFVGTNPNVDAQPFVEPNCLNGFRFDGSQCRKKIFDESVQYPKPHCPDDYSYDRFSNICVADNPYTYPSMVRPICERGFTLDNNQCVPQNSHRKVSMATKTK